MWVLGLALVAICGWALFAYNRLVGLANRASGAWADVDVQLKKRHDLVGNLVEAVRGYAHHERQVLEKVTEARTKAESARSQGRPGEAGPAESALTGEIGPLFALAEAYPDLKASEQFAGLHRSLTEVEDDLENARRYYNAVVRDLNTRIQSLPDVVVARSTGFAERDFFSLEDRSEARAPRVELGA